MSQRTAYVDQQQDKVRELHIFPSPAAATSCGMLFEDDGESHGWKEGNALWLSWEIATDGEKISIDFTQRGDFKPAWDSLGIVLPAGETRQLWVNGVKSDSYRL